MESYKKIREFLLNADYPVHMVAMMTDEDVVAEYEALTGDNSIEQPIK